MSSVLKALPCAYGKIVDDPPPKLTTKDMLYMKLSLSSRYVQLLYDSPFGSSLAGGLMPHLEGRLRAAVYNMTQRAFDDERGDI